MLQSEKSSKTLKILEKLRNMGAPGVGVNMEIGEVPPEVGEDELLAMPDYGLEGRKKAKKGLNLSKQVK